MRRFVLIACLGFLFSNLFAQDKVVTIADKTKNAKPYAGYFNFFWDEKEGKIWLEISRFDEELLYVNSLTAGVGSNDIGLDRNQLGSERVIKFQRSGPKILMIQPNYDYRALSNNPDERRSVAEAFASSTLWGFKVEAEEAGKVLVDFTPFLLRDAHGVAARLRSSRQGTYTLDASRSAIHLERTKNFPKNSEFEALITFTGEAQGEWIRSVAPSADAISVRMHHSLIELPDNKYRPREFDPRSGYYPMSFKDYASPIDQPLVKRWITRHRLEKKDPTAAISDPVEPIIYYLDRGAPEPIRSALIEGARWWNQAYEAAGYRNAFQVEVLPEGADPMDVRYNLINWVHRSTRGWSYGSSVTDPRTGEIIKGHVLLGSLRVRQDFLIASGLVSAYEAGTIADPRLKEMALQRLRQLSAHEVGHTLGLQHNFVASYNERASVMDYPHPLITIDEQGRTDYSNAYTNQIGEWDKRTIIYGYQDFPDGVDEKAALQAILKENNDKGLLYITDLDTRAPGGAHPFSHMWDNGKSPIDELKRLMAVRKKALANFSEKNIPVGAPMATLENVLVPIYLAHRYQVEATAKMVGGLKYGYTVRGDFQPATMMIEDQVQRSALNALIETLKPEFLAIPERILALIPPQPPGYQRDRELFKIHTGVTFDPLGAAESSIEHTLDMLLHPQRLSRMVEQGARDPQRLQLSQMLRQIRQAISSAQANLPEFQVELMRVAEKAYLHKLLVLAADRNTSQQVAAEALQQIERFNNGVILGPNLNARNAHFAYLDNEIRLFKQDPSVYKAPAAPDLPDGAPIGCFGEW